MEQRGGVAYERTGADGPLLVLLHGLGATGAVWSHVRQEAKLRWPGQILIPDLPGHGGSDPMPAYSVAAYADRIAPLLAGPQSLVPVTLLGHSLGGLIAIALADPGYGLSVASAFGLGIKVCWTEDELARMEGLSRRTPRSFPSEPDALAQHARVAGLVDPAPTLLARGAYETAAGWQLALDPAAFAVAVPPMRELVAAATCPVHLARGERDEMVDDATLREFDPAAARIPHAGHNAMVENPAAVLVWLLQARP